MLKGRGLFTCKASPSEVTSARQIKATKDTPSLIDSIQDYCIIQIGSKSHVHFPEKITQKPWHIDIDGNWKCENSTGFQPPLSGMVTDPAAQFVQAKDLIEAVHPTS